MKKEPVLVVVAHPDDEVLGCGGTIARLSQEGHRVFVSILGEGMTSRSNASSQDLKVLQACVQKAAKLLGVQKVFSFDLPDNRFDTVAFLEIVKIIENVIAEVQPSIIYTQHGGDLNIDHATVFRATLTASRPLPENSVRAVYGFEVASSTEWAFQQFSPSFRPNVFFDITSTLNAKIEAMRAYETEIREYPHPRSPQALEANARHWGSVAGIPAAEAFELIREIRR